MGCICAYIGFYMHICIKCGYIWFLVDVYWAGQDGLEGGEMEEEEMDGGEGWTEGGKGREKAGGKEEGGTRRAGRGVREEE